MSRALVPPNADLLPAYTLDMWEIIPFLQMVEEMTAKYILEVSQEELWSPLQSKCSFTEHLTLDLTNFGPKKSFPKRLCVYPNPVSVIIPLFPMPPHAQASCQSARGAPAQSGSVLFRLCGVISLLKLLSSQAVSPHTSGCKWIFGDSVSRVLAKRP